MNYAIVDAEILRYIRANGPVPFAPIAGDPSVRGKVKAILGWDSMTSPTVSKRLQVMRRAGEIAYDKDGWRLL